MNHAEWLAKEYPTLAADPKVDTSELVDQAESKTRTSRRVLNVVIVLAMFNVLFVWLFPTLSAAPFESWGTLALAVLLFVGANYLNQFLERFFIRNRLRVIIHERHPNP
ncbi:hypothetical protein [Marinomonas ostreistagni]|uniref:hypothetical protein n=1 Tax=Marinomonas ostreistagni TaxID=359209 RepID=UPI00195141BC|nr:hypothetical protein [Marinomonas ostreistagni]MBM6549911.1 hypothetical protein [Marinomonas ostreistagni]